MSTEKCSECGHVTKAYSDAGARRHEPTCSRNPVSTNAVGFVKDALRPAWVVDTPHQAAMIRDAVAALKGHYITEEGEVVKVEPAGAYERRSDGLVVFVHDAKGDLLRIVDGES